MSFFRYAQGVYGGETLLGASWDLIPWFAGAAAAFIVLHALYSLVRPQPEPQLNLKPGEAQKRVLRHKLVDRLYHWFLAIAVIVLLFTAFAPHLGWKFNWLTTHWTAGVILGLMVVYHIVRAIGWQDLWAMIPNLKDFRELMGSKSAGGSASPEVGKYELLQKAYHWGIASLVLILVATGATMLSKIDTPWWRRNPYWLADKYWGIIYTIHDLAAMCVLAVVLIHIYFGLRPKNFWMLRSMVLGWITKREYLSHHDPRLWKAEELASQSRTVTGDDIASSPSGTP